MAENSLTNVPRSLNEQDSTVLRRSANYLPNQWDYNFIRTVANNYTEEAFGSLVRELKEEVRVLFSETDPLAQVRLIDSVERLGVGHHFKEEIKQMLNDMLISGYHRVVQKDGLHATAIFFRLLRQHGFMISEDIFNYFKDDDGSFMASLSGDIQGLLSLYQASYLSFEGENTLDAARAFTVMHLNSLDASKSSFAGEIAYAMDLPSHWRPPRLEARRYIDIYEKEESMNSTLLWFAKLDFNMVQNIHQRELEKVMSWWMTLGLGKKLGFARDRTLECFFGVIIIVFEPQFGFCREWLPKIGALLVLLDDVYDVYGSLAELELFTNAVDRWEVEELENLPKCMKICFTTIGKVIDEMAHDIQKHNGLDILPYLQKAWTDLCKAFLVEARWQNNKCVPTLAEYIDNGWMSASGPLIIFHTFFLLRQEPTKEALEHLQNCPKVIRLASMIFRLCNDLATSTAEQERGDAPTSIQCYMKERGVSEIVAREYISSIITETWKELNQECVLCTSFPSSFVEACANLARMALCLYQHRDGFGIPTYETKGRIISLLIKPITFIEKGLTNSHQLSTYQGLHSMVAL